MQKAGIRPSCAHASPDHGRQPANRWATGPEGTLWRSLEAHPLPGGPQRSVFPSPDRSAHPGRVGPDQSTSLSREFCRAWTPLCPSVGATSPWDAQPPSTSLFPQQPNFPVLWEPLALPPRPPWTSMASPTFLRGPAFPLTPGPLCRPQTLPLLPSQPGPHRCQIPGCPASSGEGPALQRPPTFWELATCSQACGVPAGAGAAATHTTCSSGLSPQQLPTRQGGSGRRQRGPLPAAYGRAQRTPCTAPVSQWPNPATALPECTVAPEVLTPPTAALSPVSQCPLSAALTKGQAPGRAPSLATLLHPPASEGLRSRSPCLATIPEDFKPLPLILTTWILPQRRGGSQSGLFTSPDGELILS